MYNKFDKQLYGFYSTRNVVRICKYLKKKLNSFASKTTLLKLYKATKDDEGKCANVVELPFNSNDYSCAHLASSSDDKTLYFASNMPGTVSQSDIFKVAINAYGSFGTPESLGGGIINEAPETLPYNCKQIVSGVITDEETKEVLANAKVTLFDEDMNVISDMIANEKGEYKFEELECEKTYFVSAESKDYETVETSVVTGSAPGETTAKLPITKRVKQVGFGSDLAKAIYIKIIYFDLDKSNIRPDAALQLEKILQVMKQYPTMKVDVRSHTDCRQTAKYN